MLEVEAALANGDHRLFELSHVAKTAFAAQGWPALAHVFPPDSRSGGGLWAVAQKPWFYSRSTAMAAVMQHIGGDVFYAPLRIEVRPGKFREPDLLLVLDKNDPRAQDEYWTGADLVIEIVGPDKPRRDTEEKPVDYAEARIPEYWIVNPLQDTVTVLILDGEEYVEHGVFQRGERATSKLFADFSLSVDEVLDPK